MKVLILGAGQGKRLLPLTQDIPKALLDIGGRRLIERQIDAFAEAGVGEFVVLTGYRADLMDQVLANCAREKNVAIRTVYNPFYVVSDNLASCWMARAEMTGDFIQVNGDNLFRADMVEHLLNAPSRAITAVINHKPAYDDDDMKVTLDGDRLTAIGKTLTGDEVSAEAVGLYLFRGPGAQLYRQTLEDAMLKPDGLRQWFPSAIDMLARAHDVGVCAVDELEWCEVDFPADLDQARALVAGWG